MNSMKMKTKSVDKSVNAMEVSKPVKKTKAVAKKKKTKDPNAPKRAMSAFILFSNDIRSAVKSEMPELGFGELTREIAKRWKTVSDSARDKYLEMQKMEKERYEKQMSDYKNHCQDMA